MIFREDEVVTTVYIAVVFDGGRTATKRCHRTKRRGLADISGQGIVEIIDKEFKGFDKPEK